MKNGEMPILGYNEGWFAHYQPGIGVCGKRILYQYRV